MTDQQKFIIINDPIDQRNCDICIFQSSCDEGHKWSYYCDSNRYGIFTSTGNPKTCPNYIHVWEDKYPPSNKYRYLDKLRKKFETYFNTTIKTFLEHPIVTDTIVTIIVQLLESIEPYKMDKRNEWLNRFIESTNPEFRVKFDPKI